ncbi:hypothetical protein GQX73_g4329 [Xylaria multiplex]|uniref:DNA 3'-5' helicase n=1 Tax=Xylaria multiplex TaxID=323545 RepID=A0A7C8IR96_9PEZI|nr:hypothetical protein GQX73_g4329 [Xylaria multiplex]
MQHAVGEKGNLSYYLYSLNVLSTTPKDVSLIASNVLLSKPIIDLSSRILAQQITIASYRHIAIAYCRKYMQGKSIKSILGIEPDEDEDNVESSGDSKTILEITNAQAAHSTTISRMIYAVEYDTGERFNKFFQASLQWHMLFRVDGSMRGTKRARDADDDAAALEDPALDQQSQRLDNLLQLATNDTMRSMYHRSDIEMHAHQRELFEAMDKADKVIYITGTGGGKSIAFALPAYVQPEGCNVVIQPTRALQRDTFARLAAMKINVSIWEPHSTNPASSVILVTPEAIAWREWKGFVQRQRVHSRIDRVILDEAHQVLLSSQKWRPRLLQIRDDMDMVSRRQIFLTGTMPPSRLTEFKTKVGLSSRDSTIIRNKCTRDNLKYDYINLDPDLQCPQLVTDMAEQARDQGRRAIIFVMSRVECEDIARRLSAPQVYSGLSGDELTAAIKTWDKNKGPIVATTAMSEGVDHDASLVVCLGAYDMMTLCQQFGRAGRDGSPALVILVAPLASLKDNVKDFATSRCKRSAISKYLDGIPKPCRFHHNSCNGYLGLEIKADRAGNVITIARSQKAPTIRFSTSLYTPKNKTDSATPHTDITSPPAPGPNTSLSLSSSAGSK